MRHVDERPLQRTNGVKYVSTEKRAARHRIVLFITRVVPACDEQRVIDVPAYTPYDVE